MELSLPTSALISTAVSFFIFVEYVTTSIIATYYITINVNKDLQKTKYNKLIVPIITVTLFILPVILDLLFLVNALRFIYYMIYTKDLHSHVNISKFTPPDINFGVFYTLILWLIITFFHYSYHMQKARKKRVK